ncbi:hypothetical protein CFIICLFH_5006 [Methylobacterium goesingense]|nr:hypothetical protein CFIICLFH_5006 [Methylobacterium goesingense]
MVARAHRNAACVAGLGYALARRLPRSALTVAFELPTNRRIDRPLIEGAALFGIGWSLSSLCPGPAVAALSTGALPVAVFVAAMLVGMTAHQRFVARD